MDTEGVLGVAQRYTQVESDQTDERRARSPDEGRLPTFESKTKLGKAEIRNNASRIDSSPIPPPRESGLCKARDGRLHPGCSIEILPDDEMHQ